MRFLIRQSVIPDQSKHVFLNHKDVKKEKSPLLINDTYYTVVELIITGLPLYTQKTFDNYTEAPLKAVLVGFMQKKRYIPN